MAAAHRLHVHGERSDVGVRKNYYQEVNEDALVMTVHDIDHAEYVDLLASIERTVPGETIVEETRRT